MSFGFGKTHYWGLGIIFAPKSSEYPRNLVINFLCWEIHIAFGVSQEKQDQMDEINKKIEDIFKNA